MSCGNETARFATDQALLDLGENRRAVNRAHPCREVQTIIAHQLRKPLRIVAAMHNRQNGKSGLRTSSCQRFPCSGFLRSRHENLAPIRHDGNPRRPGLGNDPRKGRWMRAGWVAVQSRAVAPKPPVSSRST